MPAQRLGGKIAIVNTEDDRVHASCCEGQQGQSESSRVACIRDGLGCHCLQATLIPRSAKASHWTPVGDCPRRADVEADLSCLGICKPLFLERPLTRPDSQVMVLEHGSPVHASHKDDEIVLSARP